MLDNRKYEKMNRNIEIKKHLVKIRRVRKKNNFRNENLIQLIFIRKKIPNLKSFLSNFLEIL